MALAITIAFIMGLVTGSLVPFTVYYYRRTRSVQGVQPRQMKPGTYRTRNIADPSRTLAGTDAPVYLSDIGFRAVPSRRRVARRPVRPGPRQEIVR